MILWLLLTSSLIEDARCLSSQACEPAEPRVSERYVLAVDPRFGMEGGVRTTLSLQSGAMLYDDLISSRVVFDENVWWKKTLALLGRGAKLVVVDATLAFIATVFAHEIYGHGARGREANMWATYSFGLPALWRSVLDPKAPPYVGITENAQSGDADRDRTMVAGGIEAEHYMAFWVEAEAARRGGALRYSEALLYLAAKTTYLGALVSPASGSEMSDIGSYARGLNARFNSEQSEIDLRRKIALSYIGNALDPLLWLSAYHLIVSYGWFGQRDFRLPTIAAGPVHLMFGTRFNLTPFGPEHYLDLFGFNQRFSGNVYVRAGSSGFAFYGGVGARLFHYAPVDWLSLGAELDVFVQPQTVFGARNLYERSLIVGVNYSVSAELLVYGPVGVLGRLAYKTRGHVMGQPLDEGVHGYFGLVVRP